MTSNGDIPEGWIATPLGTVVAPSKEKVEPSTRPKSPYLSLEHIEQDTTKILDRGIGADVESTKAVFCAGDVLYGKLRPYLNKVCMPDFDGICSTDILVFPQTPQLESRYLLRFLMKRSVVEYAHHHSAGVQLPRVSFGTLGELEFPLPPLAEQRRIVAKVEELLSRVDAARQRLAKVTPLLKRFRQSVLAAACSGQLTADWRGTSVEEASDGPRALPSGWRWRALGTMGEDPDNPVQTGPFGAQLHNDEFVDSGVPVIAVGNLTGMGFTEKGLYHITTAKAKQLSRYAVNAGDVLFARSGATLGKVCVAPNNVKDWRMTGHILRVRLDSRALLPSVAVYALRGDPDVQEQVFAGVRGITRPGYNTQLLENILVPVPPLPEQHEIVRRVDALFALADKIEARVQAAAARVEKITQAILAKAFRGELVPTEAELARQEGRDYEPASVLLERIRAARTASNGAVTNGRATARRSPSRRTPRKTLRRG